MAVALTLELLQRVMNGSGKPCCPSHRLVLSSRYMVHVVEVNDSTTVMLGHGKVEVSEDSAAVPWFL
jgi:hypothetical protein